MPPSPLPPRINVTPEQIDRVVAAFYDAVRRHPGLGPVFAAHVKDWAAHEEKISRFWRNAILYERSYDGNPLAVHTAAGNVMPGMFVPWLGLFDTILTRELPADVAAQWSALAHRIGQGLRYGLSQAQGIGTGDVPKLR